LGDSIFRMQANKMGDQGVVEVEWDSTFFKEAYDACWTVIKEITVRHKPLSIFRQIADKLKKEGKLEGGTEPKRFGETRFGSRVMMGERMEILRIVFEKLMTDDDYVAWLAKQDKAVKEKLATVKATIQDDKFWEHLAVADKVLLPALAILRFADGMKGGTLGLLYHLLLQLDQEYQKPIEGLDDEIRKKMHEMFMLRWGAFHAPVMTAAFAMDRLYCRRPLDAEQKREVLAVMNSMSKAPGSPSFNKMKAEYSAFQQALGKQQHFFHDRIVDGKEHGAFTKDGLLMAPEVWIETYMESV